MLVRALIFAFFGIALAMVVGQSAPGWLAGSQGSEEVAAEPAVKPGMSARPLQDRQVALRAGPGGHVMVDGFVNDRAVKFMVDTGATVVVLNEATARHLGFHPSRSDFTGISRTANGAVPVAPVRLGEIRVADILVRDVQAVIVPGEMLDGNLLGMSFLNRLREFEFQGDRLVLTQ